jgi:SAM-dependent methyltransferase
MGVYTTEITSEVIPSDNPLHQRLLKAYIAAVPFIKGDLLELGCGEGRGIDWIAPKATSYSAIDKIEPVINKLMSKYPQHKLIAGHFPPFPYPDGSFDTIVSFQVIEHIKDDQLFLKEIHRILKPGGTALITTPNILMTLSRNPWHIREYTAAQLIARSKQYFDQVKMMGIAGNEKVMEYYQQNKVSVHKIMRFDVLNLQYRLPASLLRLPYEWMNRLNRNSLHKAGGSLVGAIGHEDYYLNENDAQNLDLFCILQK